MMNSSISLSACIESSRLPLLWVQEVYQPMSNACFKAKCYGKVIIPFFIMKLDVKREMFKFEIYFQSLNSYFYNLKATLSSIIKQTSSFSVTSKS